jgi:coproporphyrinogen III oxidase
MTVAFAPAGITPRQARVLDTMLAAQERLIAGFEGIEAAAAAEGPPSAGTEAGAEPRCFGDHGWLRPAGGGGRARVIEDGRVFERGGVNVSAVVGERVPPTLAAQHPGTEGKPWFATGVSLVLHPRNPHVPAFHANFRYFEVGATAADAGAEPAAWWFGGGADLTPAYPVAADVRAFHGALAAWCARHPQADYPAWKAACDAYFTVRHRGEMRGVGGVFFDELTSPGASLRGTTHRDTDRSFDADLACIEDGIATLLPAYLPLVERHRRDPYGERERRWQALRRGRYVEFNLVYDRGTLFGLQTGGHIEAILMSMPPLAGWAFDHQPEPGGPEAAALAFYQPRDWGQGGADAVVDPGITSRRTA